MGFSLQFRKYLEFGYIIWRKKHQGQATWIVTGNLLYFTISEKEKLWPPILVNMKRSNELHALCALNLVSASQQSKNIYKKDTIKATNNGSTYCDYDAWLTRFDCFRYYHVA